MLNPLIRSCAAALFAGVFATQVFGAAVARSDEPAARLKPNSSLPPAPIINWAAPQFYNAPAGAFSSDGTFGSKPEMKAQGGTARTLATFIPVTPCRLVDTRGFFTPVYVGASERDANPVDPTPRAFVGNFQNGTVTPGSGPAATNGEFRDYKVAGNCGVPAGNNRVIAVSIAVTTLPTGTSGDIEVTQQNAPLGKSVVMVMGAGLWNSAASEVPVNPANGEITVQARSPNAQTAMPVDMAVDVNGYYAIMDPSNTSDYFSVFGNYNFDGGLFNVTETGSVGAAINAVGSAGSEVHLAQGGNAIDIVSGGIRVRQTTPTSAPAYVFDVTGHRCSDLVGGGTNQLVRLNNIQVTGAGLNGVMIFVQPRNQSAKPVNVVYGTCNNPSDPTPDGWYLFSAGGFNAGEQYNVLIVKP